MKNRRFNVLMLVLLLLALPEVDAGFYFYVQFKDKNGSPFSLANPSEYLSERAIQRRAGYNTPTDSTDLPVNPRYIRSIANAGVHVHCTTKWLNGATVLVADSAVMAAVRALPFVQSVQYTGITPKNPPAGTPLAQRAKAINFDYGAASDQINQLNGSALHQNGFNGENIHIAVIDAGFSGVDTNPAFQKLRDENRLLGTKDFVDPQSNIYNEDAHGAQVLSTMAAEIDGTFVGTAPRAAYWLIRTEAAAGEYLYEPDLWISGVEYADSAGVDLATTSLGYTTFDDTRMNYTYNQLDGKTIRASRAAEMACGKGMMLLNSAGNDGNKPWKYIGVPADAAGVITVGSVTKEGVYSPFSSIGFTPDGRVKPELCATGTQSAIIQPNGTTIRGNGTSFATPILAGLTACLLQVARAKLPGHSLDELRNDLFRSANRYHEPTAQLGYGIPNFSAVYSGLLAKASGSIRAKRVQKMGVLNDRPLRLFFSDLPANHARWATVFSVAGQRCGELEIVNQTVIIQPGAFPAGIYVVTVESL